MYIEWNITKERGNVRPMLNYRVRLEEHEKALAIPSVSVLSTIPKPEEHTLRFCYPGVMERATDYQPKTFYTLEAPSHVGHSPLHTLILPWREDNTYPEIEISFELLRSAIEAALDQALASEPIRQQGEVRSSHAGKVRLAPTVAAERLLRLAATQNH